MKNGIIAIAGGLLATVAITGCQPDTTEWENKVNEANKRTQFVADSVALDYQGRVDSLQAIIDSLTAPVVEEPTATTGTSKPKTSTPKKEEPKQEEKPTVTKGGEDSGTTKGGKKPGEEEKKGSTVTKGGKPTNP